MHILTLNSSEIGQLLEADALVDALAEGFKALSGGQVDAPKRS